MLQQPTLQASTGEMKSIGSPDKIQPIPGLATDPRLSLTETESMAASDADEEEPDIATATSVSILKPIANRKESQLLRPTLLPLPTHRPATILHSLLTNQLPLHRSIFPKRPSISRNGIYHKPKAVQSLRYQIRTPCLQHPAHISLQQKHREERDCERFQAK
jgi:hypothetical protein